MFLVDKKSRADELWEGAPAASATAAEQRSSSTTRKREREMRARVQRALFSTFLLLLFSFATSSFPPTFFLCNFACWVLFHAPFHSWRAGCDCRFARVITCAVKNTARGATSLSFHGGFIKLKLPVGTGD
jgi:hypothetical protein